ncbi:MAG TPA: ABC transporter permease [Bacteroidales bacterium]|nr:ABC transporter permease [Bacteroidales bacterium]
MNTPLFIARKSGLGNNRKSYGSLITKISILSIALGLAVMLLSVSVVTGFQSEIREKVIGFGAHFQITGFQQGGTAELLPISRDTVLVDDLMQMPGITHIQEFAAKTGIIKTQEEIHGVVMKGVGVDFDWDFFSEKMVAGSAIALSDTATTNQVVISKTIAEKLSLEVGDNFIMYFIQEPPAIRRFTISGIYETGLEELDRKIILGDIRHIQRLNQWTSDQIGGYEVLVESYEDIFRMQGPIFHAVPFQYNVQSIRELYPQIFDWLALLDMNVYVILFLMVLVAGINMITTLLIAVLEKTNLIGILKAIGSSNKLVRKVFLYNAAFVIVKGLIFGNLLGLTLSLLQLHFGIVTLPKESYYVSVVPINLNFLHFILINAGTFLICMFMLLLPSYIITRISPVKAIAYK